MLDEAMTPSQQPQARCVVCGGPIHYQDVDGNGIKTAFHMCTGTKVATPPPAVSAVGDERLHDLRAKYRGGTQRVDPRNVKVVQWSEVEAICDELLQARATLERYEQDYPVVCARCHRPLMASDSVAEEGDEWECLPCNERENARECAE